MGLVLMSEHKLQRIEVLAQVLDGSLRTATAAHVLDLNQRQVQRLIREVQADGAMAVRHKLRGRPSNNRISDLKRDYILSLIRTDYPDFGRRWPRRCWPNGMASMSRRKRFASG